MFSLSICMGNVVWALRFKTEENLKAAELPFLLQEQPDDWITCADDFEQVVRVRRNSVHGIMVEDMTKSREAHIAQMLHNASMQQEAQRRAQTQTRGPSIVSPSFPGMARPQG